MIVTESRTQLPKCHLLELSLRELAVYIHDEQPNTSAAKVGERRVQGIAEEPFSFLTTSLSSLFVSGHRNTPTTGTTRVDINTTRGDHRNALPPRRRVGPEAAPSSRAARACCAGRCLISYILHSLWFPAQAPDIVGLLPRDPAECPSIPRQLYM